MLQIWLQFHLNHHKHFWQQFPLLCFIYFFLFVVLRHFCFVLGLKIYPFRNGAEMHIYIKLFTALVFSTHALTRRLKPGKHVTLQLHRHIESKTCACFKNFTELIIIIVEMKLSHTGIYRAASKSVVYVDSPDGCLAASQSYATHCLFSANESLKQ